MDNLKEKKDIPSQLPLLAVRDVVIFTDMILPLYIGRDVSVAAIEAAQLSDKLIFIVTQKDQENEEPKPADLYTVGTVAMIMRQLKMADGRIKILVQGLAKAKIIKFLDNSDYLQVQLEILEEEKEIEETIEIEALIRNVKEQSQKILSLKDIMLDEINSILDSVDDPSKLADLIAGNLRMKVSEAQEVLESLEVKEKLILLNEILTKEFKISTLKAEMEAQSREELDRTQKEYYLREQLKVIKRELGDEAGRDEEADDYKAKIKKAKLPREASTEALKQLSRLEMMHPDSADAALIRTYLDWLVELPWSFSTRDQLDLIETKKVLDKAHYGLEKVKDRILEYLAIRKLNKNPKSPIICFLGPPGVGKTSLGKSIAEAMGRKFIRFSLGGMRDEAEIRGHRRTYIGALPGRILQGLKTTGSNNPVFMLDEVDKIGSDFRGDPSSALLEVLDPEQNNNFSDHYLNLPFDLSKVLFITTANMIDTVPEALEDRMEVISIPGYLAEEKLEIAKRHIVPRILKDHGLKKDKVSFSDRAIQEIIKAYTLEAGVRGLEKKLAAVLRKIARKVAEGSEKAFKITVSNVSKYLGPPIIIPEPERKKPEIGVATGLAWTEVGGELMYIETRSMPGKGNLTLTGQLGDVMKESAQAALAYTRSHSEDFGLKIDFYDEIDLHIHVPAGSIPKEGPSAGVSLMASLISVLIKKPVPLDIAMTGEITLRGQVMAIGGLKEKALAALQSGIKKVIIPKQNIKDLEEIPSKLRNQIKFIPVDNLDEFLQVVFGDYKQKLNIKRTSKAKKSKKVKVTNKSKSKKIDD